MKKLITILIAGLFTLASYGQSGVLHGPGGLWIGSATTLTPVFKIGVTPVTTTVAQLNYLNTLTGNAQTQLDTINNDLGRGVVFPTPGTSGNVLTSNGTAWGSVAPPSSAPSFVGGLQGLGSTIKAYPIALQSPTVGKALSDNTLFFIAVYLSSSQTITGVKLSIATSGSYTASDYNGVGLYSQSAGTLTLRASSTDNGNIWKTAPGMLSIAFSSTYVAVAGTYYIAISYQSSVQVTAPVLYGGVLGDSLYALYDLTNSNKLVSYLGATTLPTPTQAASGLTVSTNIHWVTLY